MKLNSIKKDTPGSGGVLIVTGGLASGKSYVCDIFGQRRFEIINTDKIAHDVLAHEAKDAVIHEFGDQILDGRGEIDRAVLGNAIFFDSEKLTRLENITHPLIYRKRKEIVQKIQKNSDKSIVIETPLFFECEIANGVDIRYDVVISTIVDVKTQKQRAFDRSGIEEKKFYAIISRQLSNASRRLLADFVIDTSQSRENIEKAVERIIGEKEWQN